MGSDNFQSVGDYVWQPIPAPWGSFLLKFLPPPSPSAARRGSRAQSASSAYPAPSPSSQVRKQAGGVPEGCPSARGAGGRGPRARPPSGGAALSPGGAAGEAVWGPDPSGARSRRTRRNGQSSVFPGVSRGPWVRPPGPLKARHGSESLGEAPGAASPGRRRSRPAPLAPRRKCDPAPAACGPGRPPAPVGLTAAGGSSRPVHGGLPRCAGLGRKGLRATRGRVCASRAGSPAREQGA